MNERIVFMGTPKLAAYILEGLIDANYNIVGVVTQPDKEVGRKRILTPSEVKNVALKYNIPVYTPTRIRNEYADILALDPELIITSAYGQIIPKAILDYPKYHCINTHGSLLPLHRGGAPIQRAIINGDKVTGMSLMYMNEKMDDGDILYQKQIDIDIHDTNSTLFDKLAILGLDMLLELLPKVFSNDIHPIKQDSSLATFSYNLTKEEEHIDFNDKTLNVYNHIRGMLDNPGCYGLLEGKKYKLIKVFFEEANDTSPNKFLGLIDDYLRIDCKDGYIKVFEIKPEGKNSMSAKDFFNGAGRNLVGKYFG
ncbi:MAG: methionyl-tRNA formyltransferase [Erysipelotrichaceae bacterium]|nr:methionyl-tRNA formyltransferase [Erysipelotrichaceae bacterium]